MTEHAWHGVLSELDSWSHEGLRARFWVRDDDACELSDQLMQLYRLADRYNIIVGLAIIPGKMKPNFVDVLSTMKERFYPMCHGLNHTDYGRPGEPNEFGRDRPFSVLRSDAKLALELFVGYFGTTNSIFVPPFGRITSRLLDALPEIGFSGVSTGPSYFEQKVLQLSSKLPWIPAVSIPEKSTTPRFDVHIDVLDWEKNTARDRSAVAMEIVKALRFRRRGFVSTDRPIGLLTHHLVHGNKVWDLCKELLGLLAAHKAVSFLNADRLTNDQT